MTAAYSIACFFLLSLLYAPVYKAVHSRHSVAMNAVAPVALAPCLSYNSPALDQAVFQVLEVCGLQAAGLHVLVKPNLLTATPLACTSPAVVAAACQWLLDQGARVCVGDSPGFGRARNVAHSIGLVDALRPLGLSVEELDSPQPLRLDLPAGRTSRMMVARQALESNLILSIPRVKVHCQMLLTLAVKNCFGCVSSLRKALVHTREGRDPALFADSLAALWAALPPVAGLADGITAMHVTGPSRGQPYPLGLLGASSHAVALDAALCAVLGLELGQTPLGAALIRRKASGCVESGWELTYPLCQPDDFVCQGFRLPGELMHTSFRPLRFLQSCIRRLWAARTP